MTCVAWQRKKAEAGSCDACMETDGALKCMKGDHPQMRAGERRLRSVAVVVSVMVVVLLSQCIASSMCLASDAEELQKLYSNRQYDIVVQRGEQVLDQKPQDLDVRLLVGRALTHGGNYAKAVSHLLVIARTDTSRSWRYAWACVYLGWSYYGLGREREARKYLEYARTSRSTRNATMSALDLLMLYGFHESYCGWRSVRTRHLQVRISPLARLGDERTFLSERERAYEHIETFLGKKIERRIRFFVWPTTEEAEHLGMRPLGFARAEVYVIHASDGQTPGHEIAHVLAYHAARPDSMTDLINEGFAVLFDGRERDRMSAARSAMLENGVGQVSIPQVWCGGDSVKEAVLYPVAGAFVERLIQAGGRDKFMRLLGRQTMTSARQIYASMLDEVVKGFEKDLELGPGAAPTPR